MRLLLDTHALIWFANGDVRLPRRVRERIENSETELFVSAASAWEIAAKHRKGKLPQADFLVSHWEDVLLAFDIRELPVTGRHAFQAGSLLFANGDPFDRMIVAQARIENLVVASNETTWDGLGIARLWDADPS